MDYTIKEVKKKKIEFEESMISLIKAFEKETGVKVRYFNIERENDNQDEVPVTKEDDRGKVINVSTEIDILDVI